MKESLEPKSKLPRRPGLRISGFRAQPSESSRSLLNLLTIPLFPAGKKKERAAEITKQTERAWEAEHPYDRYETDTSILRVPVQDITRLASVDDVSKWSKEKKQMARKAISQREIVARAYPNRFGLTFDEVQTWKFANSSAEKIEGWTTEYRTHVTEIKDRLEKRYQALTEGTASKELPTYTNMWKRVQQEWREHYFLPRVEICGTEEYNKWIASYLRQEQTAGRSVETNAEGDLSQFTAFYRATNSLELLPEATVTDERDRVSIIVPPTVEVTEMPDSRTTVYYWEKGEDGVLTREPHEGSVLIYPSTKAYLRAEAKALGAVSPVQTLDDIEFSLRQKKNNEK